MTFINEIYPRQVCFCFVPLQVWTGPEGSRKLRFPDFVTMAQDGGRYPRQVISLIDAKKMCPPKAQLSSCFKKITRETQIIAEYDYLKCQVTTLFISIKKGKIAP